MATDYTTRQEVKDYGGITTTNKDAEIDALIPAMSRLIDRICNRQFYPETDTWYYDAEADVRGRLLMLHTDFTQITEVVNGDSNTIAASNYQTYPTNLNPFWGVKLNTTASLNWTWVNAPDGAIAITGRIGFCTNGTDTPEPIKHVARRLTFWALQQEERPFQAAALPEIGIAELPSSLPSDVQTILSMYTRPIIARGLPYG